MTTIDVVLTGGQSQMSGVGTGTDAPDTDPAFAKEWDGPVGSAIGQCYDPWPTARNSATDCEPQTGSCLPSFANTFTAASGRPLLVVRAATGGTALLHSNANQQGDWSTSGTRFNTSVTRALAGISAATSAGYTIGNVFVIWSQGYRDAQGGHDLDQYGAAQTALLTRWRTALSQPALKLYIEELYAPEAADSTTAANCLYLKDQQHQSIAAAGGGILIGFNEGSTYAARNWVKIQDHLHYTQPGLNYMGYKFARFVATDLGFTVPDTTPITPAAPTSLLGRRLSLSTPLPPLPRTYQTAGTYTWTVPLLFTGDLVFECEGGGGNGGNGGIGIKGSAGGGGAYAKKTITDPVPGETYTFTVGAAASFSQVVRDSTSTVICKAVGGTSGANGTPNSDGAGGAAASCIGDVTTSGQAGGVSGADNGGNGAAPLGGAGGVYAVTEPGTPGTAPGGGGAASQPGSHTGGAGAVGAVKVSAL